MTITIAVCNKSKTILNLHEIMADNNKEEKGRSSYNWFFTDGDWDEDEIAGEKSGFMIPITKRKANILRAQEGFSTEEK
jgi:hypothetical protein